MVDDPRWWLVLITTRERGVELPHLVVAADAAQALSVAYAEVPPIAGAQASVWELASPYQTIFPIEVATEARFGEGKVHG